MADTNPVKVGLYQNRPKVFTNDNTGPAGIFVELLDEIALQENWEIEYVECQWGQCLEDLKTGKIDLMLDVAFSTDRDNYFDFNITPVIESWSQIYASPKIKLKNLYNLSGKRVVVLKNAIQVDVFENLMAGFGYEYEQITANSYEEAFGMVQDGKADAVIANRLFGDFHFEKFGLNKTPVVFNPVQLHFAVAEGKNTFLLKTIDKYLNMWIETSNSFYYDTLKKHLGPHIRTTEKRFPLLLLITISLLLILTLFILLLFRRRVRTKSHYLEGTREKLKQEEYKFRNYIENAPFGIFVADENGYYLEVNPASEKITEYKRNELIGMHIRDLTPEEEYKNAGQHFRSVVETGKATGVYQFKKKTGEMGFWTVDAVKISDTRFLAMVQDITDRVKTEIELKELKNQLQTEVEQKTRELKERISELEHFHEVTIEREFRINELNEEIKRLKRGQDD
ncbi:MAG: transporter substrate-binding domain-containing protein [Bacteroidales bacterium]|nr:transporter substrate-binding domain-containing protein [Bacteroidales bacterium]MCF8344598.1 transporter substrate-binding domain-containing protein [Bacteroidales bacterium]MCF8352550.1 transporter substrate-binding domain-containing protein [Bacteroidales bacterium]MCF8376968.1 transporter substrate-binding domain-containing protein [Bacteroidales bacterium]MCF8400879.1 transporter substrate-binding domain-containing protein [Bacteroidales bacterium]